MPAVVETDRLHMQSVALGSVTLTGTLGRRHEVNLGYLLWRGLDRDRWLFPFEHRDRWERVRDWDGEYAGKWLEAAAMTILPAAVTGLDFVAKEVAARLCAAQEPDGYLGTELPPNRLESSYPLWEHWYAMKGLRTYAQLCGDEASMTAFIRAGDWLYDQFHPIVDDSSLLFTFHRDGLSILDELAELYATTSDSKYLELGAAAIEHYPPFRTMRESGKVLPMHAYCLMSFLGGAVMIAHAREDTDTIGWLARIWDDIAQNHLFPTASVSTGELFALPPADKPENRLQETCATLEWMLFTDRLYEATGDVRYPNMLERTIRNALLGAQSRDGKKWTYYTALRPVKSWFEGGTDCCYFSGPRGIARLPQLVYRTEPCGIRVDLFESSTARLQVRECAVTLKQESIYPAEGLMRLTVEPESGPVAFALKVRIPEHTRSARVNVNGEPATSTATAGEYVALDRTWQSGDRVEVTLEPEVWVARLSDESMVIVRGTEVLALDGRDNDTNFDRVALSEPVSVEDADPSARGRQRYRVSLDVNGVNTPLLMTPFWEAGNPSVGVMAKDIRYRAAFPVHR
jgi:uncharacterized protein